MEFFIDPAECEDIDGIAVCVHRGLKHSQFIAENGHLASEKLHAKISELKQIYKPESSIDGYVLDSASETNGEKIVAFVTDFFEGKILQVYLTPASEWVIG